MKYTEKKWLQMVEALRDTIRTKDIAKRYGISRQRVNVLRMKGQLLPEAIKVGRIYVWLSMPHILTRKTGRPKRRKGEKREQAV